MKKMKNSDEDDEMLKMKMKIMKISEDVTEESSEYNEQLVYMMNMKLKIIILIVSYIHL
jgi:hypothetical protein